MDSVEALLAIAIDLTRALTAQDRYQRLLDAVRRVLPCDAAALLRLEGGELASLAVYGLRQDVLGRRFRLDEHPRLERICRGPSPVRFAPNSPLPDPFDGMLLDDPTGAARVHACMGCALHVEGEIVGALTADARAADAFDALDLRLLSALGALAGAAVRTSDLVEALERSASRQGAIARDLMKDATARSGRLLGASSAIENLRREIALVGPSEFPVLVSGETGSGKEVVVRAIHTASTRRDAPMAYVNCAALPESLAESELFGHKKGAFTGATADRAGKFELADGGTLFLDEIGELPLALQAKLLRALQQGEIQRVGADAILRVNVRIIAATNRDLPAEVEAGRFRADLYHRLHVYPLRVAPLRERRDDIAELAGHFLETARASLGGPIIDLHPAALAALIAYDWPGNVRELEHLILRASLKLRRRATSRAILYPQDLDLPQAESAQAAPVSLLDEPLPAGGLREAVDAYQWQMIARALDACDGNWTQAAQLLKLDRANLQRLARRVGVCRIDTPESN
jgi:anaerobic nitric oxide reductase transcription regulator